MTDGKRTTTLLPGAQTHGFGGALGEVMYIPPSTATTLEGSRILAPTGCFHDLLILSQASILALFLRFHFVQEQT